MLANANFSVNLPAQPRRSGHRFQMSRGAARTLRSLVRIAQSCMRNLFYSSIFSTRLCEKQRALLDRVRREQVLISRWGVKGLD
jgi:hypothetical protein